MKRTILFFLLLLSSSFCFSQALINIDSVKVQPANPTATDSVYLHIYGWCGYGAALNGPPTVINNGFNHAVSACYIVNVLAVITTIHDSVYLFNGPAGMHNVTWIIQQNSDQFTPVCDTLVTNGSQNVNVLTTSINDETENNFVASWNPSTNSINYSFGENIPGRISIYSVSGQVISTKEISGPKGEIILGESRSGWYLIVFENEQGVLARKKVFVF